MLSHSFGTQFLTFILHFVVNEYENLLDYVVASKIKSRSQLSFQSPFLHKNSAILCVKILKYHLSPNMNSK